MEQSTRRTRIPPVLLVGGLIAFYWPAIAGGSYLFADDYAFRQVALQGGFHWFFNIFTQMGRPITGVFSKLAYEHLALISDYTWLRAFGLVGTIAFALYGYRLARKSGWSAGAAAGGMLLFTTTPAWAVWVGWPACTIYPLGALCALRAGESLLDDYERLPRRIVSGLCWGLVSTGIYQLSTAAILLPLFFRLARPFPLRDPLIWKVLLLSGVTGTVFFLNFGFIRAIKPFFEVAYLSRDGLVNNLSARFEVIFQNVLPRHLHEWTAFSPPEWRFLSIALLLAALSFLLLDGPTEWKERGKRLAGGGLIFLLFAIALSPLILVGQDSLPWRVFVVSCGIVVLLPFLACTVNGASRVRWIRGARLVGAVAFAAIQLGIGQYVFREGFVAPNAEEATAWKNLLHAQFSERPAHFTYLVPYPPNEEQSTVADIYEYGRGFGSYVWMGQFMINTLFDEIFPESPRGETASTSIPDHLRPYVEPCPTLIEGWRVTSPNHPAEALPIQGTRQHPLLGELKVIRHYWTAGWMGAFDYENWPRLRHASFGDICLEEYRSRPQVIWFENEDGNHFGLRPEKWPQVYWEEGKVWLDPCDYFTVLKLEPAD